MSEGLFTLPCKYIGTLHARWLLKTAKVLGGGCTSECIFPASNFDVAQNMGCCNSKSANYSNSCRLI